MKLLRPTGFHHKVAISMAVLLLFQTVFPVAALALTSGPTQPEFNEFEPVGTTQMVDLFSGDFTYNIPLFELPGPDGGYPFNLSYHSGITMDQEASWVGLGWSMNHGAITRTMRGLPDDFDGDEVMRKMDMRENKTWKFGVGGQFEIFAKEIEGDADAGEIDGGSNLGLSLGLNVMHNSYKGWGIGLSAAPKFSMLKTNGFGFSGSLSVSVSGQEGASLQPSFSFSKQGEKWKSAASISGSFNSREGVAGISLGVSGSKVEKKKDENTGETYNEINEKFAGSQTFNFGRAAYSPQIGTPYRGKNFSGKLEVGGNAFLGIGVGGSLSASLYRQRLKDKNVFTKTAAYGYFYLQNSLNDDSALTDFNREKDGPIHKESPNLAIPISTPDIYSLSGQGTGGSYRAYRSSVGIFSDPAENSFSGGGNLGFDLNFGNTFDLGADLGGNMAFTESGRYVSGIEGKLNFGKKMSNADEPYYFKAAGEITAELYDEANASSPSSDYIAGSEAVRVKLGGKYSLNRMDANGLGVFEKNEGTEVNIPNGVRTERKPRSSSIQQITNGELLGPNGIQESLSEYRVDFYDDYAFSNGDYTAGITNYVRDDSEDKKSHIAGITSLQANGMRYVYALPVKNMTQEEIMFSVNRGIPSQGFCQAPIHDRYAITDQETVDHIVTNSAFTSDDYLNHSVIPEYTHAHLLTSVLGADYVDFTGDGPSDDDYGYWVKFNYVKTDDDFKWRAPFFGANYIEGAANDQKDDKATITYGEREQYYLGTAETKTHIAVFEISDQRTDGKGAADRTQKNKPYWNTKTKGQSFQLEKVSLYSKLEKAAAVAEGRTAVPIKEINLSYDQSLCPGIHNGTDGKLTLRSLSFSYQNSIRGALSPYRFDYNTGASYSDMNYDRWGTYRNSDSCEKLNFPYTRQDDDKADLDNNAAMWHLNKIGLPSGATIEVDYETDDYAYVQDRHAMQMFEISEVRNLENENNSTPTDNLINTEDGLASEELRVYFFQDASNADPSEYGIPDLCDYVKDLHGAKLDPNNTTTCGMDLSEAQIYFKVKIELKNKENNEDNKEFVSGYAKVADVGTDPGYGPYVELQPTVLDGRSYHPFSAAAWQHLKMNYPDRLRKSEGLNSANEDNFMSVVGDFISAFGEMGAIFRKYYRYCSRRGFASEVELGESYIRLNTPDGVKYGGGSRVKKVTLKDNWDIGEDGNTANDVATYGQVYDYTTMGKNSTGGVVPVSSGVAANEPAVGADESALRFAKPWAVRAALKSDQNLFFEYPANESYYPGPSVGYSKVTVKSLATAYAQGEENLPAGGQLPIGFGTTGTTINEFYTAKDFPVIVEETELDDRQFPIKVSPPFSPISLSIDKYTGTQGYAITLNDMHGKPSSITHYGLDSKDKISEVKYYYSESDKEVYTAAGKLKETRVLNNIVNVLVDDNVEGIPDLGNPNFSNANILPAEMGVNYDFFLDARRASSISSEGNVGINGDFSAWPPAFSLAGFPSLSMNESETKTVVTNKIIRKTGILKRTDAYDGQSLVTTSNKVFDPLTGEPLLTTVNNSYVTLSADSPPIKTQDKIYNYNIPARLAYERMGAAYENWGTKFTATLGFDNSCGLFTMSSIGLSSLLVPGDECIITDFVNGQSCNDFIELCDNPKFIFVGIDDQGTSPKFLFENAKLNEQYVGLTVNVMIARSGNRNHLSAKSGSITALSDPTVKRVTSSESVDVPGVATSLSINNRKIDNVLNASAVTYQNFWDLERFITPVTSTIDVTTYTPASCTKHFIVSDAQVALEPNNVRVAFTNPSSDCPMDMPGIVNSNGGISNRCSFEYANWFNGGSGYPSGPGGTTYPFSKAFLCSNNSFNPFPITFTVNRSSTNGGKLYTVNSINDFPITIEVDDFAPGVYPTPVKDVEFTYMTTGDCYVNECGVGTTTTTEETRGVTRYEYGEKGIWRPFQNYTYVTPRNSTIDETNPSVVPDLSEDGTFNNFTLFDWENPFFKYSPGAEDWKETNRITKYAANGEEVENRDIIGLHSAALYAYKDNLPVAVAANASHYEVAFEGFETLEEEGTKGNLDFLCNESKTRYLSNTYEIFGGYTGEEEVNIDKLFESGDLVTEDNTYALLVLEDEAGNEYEATGDVQSISSAGLYNTFNKQVSTLNLTNLDFGCTPLPSGTVTTGRVIVKQEKYVGATNNTNCDNNNNVILASDWSHSGGKSLMIDVANGYNFNQGSTELQPGKTYVLSAWVSLGENFDGHTLEDKIQIAYDPQLGDNDFVSFMPSGPMINGWQRIEGTFVAEGGITNPDGFWTIGFDVIGSAQSMNLPAYVDDIRIYPLDGNIQTYVYDPLDYRLSAVLDNNNFATFYHYDEEGNLFLVKKETAEGVKTIQETREYVKNTSNRTF